MERTNLHSYSIYAWSLISPIVTISLIFASELWFLIGVCLLGGLYGNFLLKFFADFGGLTVISERGRAGGFIGFISILVMSFLTVVSLLFGFVGSVLLCSFLSLLPFLTTRLATRDPVPSVFDLAFSFKRSCWRNRDFFLYLIPWLVYNLVNAIIGRYGITSLIDQLHLPFIPMMVLSNVTSCMGALIGGFIADIYGRKKALGVGLTSYGISSAFSGLIYSEIQDSLLVFLLFALNGLSWGIFFVLYFFVVWEDLSDMNNSSSYYIGVSFYSLTMSLAHFLPPSIQFPLVNLALASCVLIFSSNIFLVVAQELLSRELRREFDLFVYLEQVKKFFKERHKGSN